MRLVSFLRKFVFSSPGLLVILTIAMTLLLSTGPISITRTTTATQAGTQSELKKKISLANSIPKEIKVLRLDHIDDENWFETFECEIQNASEKKIVFIYFMVGLPQFDQGNNRVAFVMRYGEQNAATVDEPNRMALLPGEKYIFKIDPKHVANLTKQYSDGVNPPRITALRFDFNMVWFSDRTGYVMGKPVTVQPDGLLPFVVPNQRSSASPPNPDTLRGRALPTRVSLRAGSGLFFSSKAPMTRENGSAGAYWCEGQTGLPNCGNYVNYTDYCASTNPMTAVVPALCQGLFIPAPA